MLNYNKNESSTGYIQSIDKIDFESVRKIKTSDVIKFNLGVAYFIILTFLLLKLIFT